MDTQLIGGILGIVCLGFAAIGAFLIVPDRELTVRERIGMHTIFWVFVVYAMWTIFTLFNGKTLEKYFFMLLPFLMGLLISLLAEYTSKRPPISIEDARLMKITTTVWYKLPNSVKRALQGTILNIQEVPEWSQLDKEGFKPYKKKVCNWSTILPLPARGLIHISKSDCQGLPDNVIAGAIAHEFALAYQMTHTPFDAEAIDKAGDSLPLKWNFKKETSEFNTQREADKA